MNTELNLGATLRLAPIRLDALRDWWRSRKAAQLAAHTRDELHALDDYRLRDLGIHRDQIDSLFR